MSKNFAGPNANQYVGKNLFDRILFALQANGKGRDQLTLDDLMAVDHFHTRGRQSTEELAAMTSASSPIDGSTVLDVGCGLGGTARFLASRFNCNVTGIDQSQDYVQTAAQLSQLVGLDGRNAFLLGSATDLPFEAASFDLVWTEHAQMNIADKTTYLSEVARVLKPSGRFVFHDVFLGKHQGDLNFPVPWADRHEISYLISTREYEKLLESCGIRMNEFKRKDLESQEAFATAINRTETQPAPTDELLGLHLLMGNQTRQKFVNYLEGLQRGVISVAMGVASKST